MNEPQGRAGRGPVYLDYNATAPVRPAAAEAVVRALGVCGNASSVHAPGRLARRLIEDARDAVAALAGAAPSAVIFTSGGTEANATALGAFGTRRVLASAVEHVSVLKGATGRTIPVDDRGIVDLGALESLLAADDRPALVAVMLANNETGVIQPVAEVASVAKAYGAIVHCDAVQAAGKMALDVAALGVDSLALSAHKLGGPQGVGALVLGDPDADLVPLLGGGGQERNRRAGTENLPGCAGFGAAAAAARGDVADCRRLADLRDRLEEQAVRIMPDLVVVGAGAPRLPNTSCLAVPGLSAQTMLMALDLAGVAVSSGAACSSGKVAASHVLDAMGARHLAASAIRVSLGWASVETDVERFIEAFSRMGLRRSGHPHGDHRALV
jgi:cysteine desulfurase